MSRSAVIRSSFAKKNVAIGYRPVNAPRIAGMLKDVWKPGSLRAIRGVGADSYALRGLRQIEWRVEGDLNLVDFEHYP